MENRPCYYEQKNGSFRFKYFVKDGKNSSELSLGPYHKASGNSKAPFILNGCVYCHQLKDPNFHGGNIE